MNAMRDVRIDKVTLNFGAGKDQNHLAKGIALIKMLTNKTAVKTVTQKRIPGWGLRPGLPVGAKLTLRGKEAKEVLARLLAGRENKIAVSSVDDNGNISFGVPEYIDVPGAKYDPAIGIIGLEVSVTLMRPGYRVMRRHTKRSRVGKNHRVNKEDSMRFMKETFKTEFVQ